MSKLYRRNRTVSKRELGHARVTRYLAVAPDAGAPMRDATLFLHSSCLGKHDSGPTDRKPAEVHQMPIVQMSIMRGVLAHWRDDDAIARFNPPNSKTAE